MRNWWMVIFLIGALVLAVLIFTPAQQSPLAEEEKIQELLNDPILGHDLLLPTSLPGKMYLRDVLVRRIEHEQPYVMIEGDLILQDGGHVGFLRILEQKTDLEELPTVGGVSIEAVKRVINEKWREGTLNRIGKLEAVQVADGTGYWYTRVDAAHGQFEAQVIEFLQDGYRVEISVNLHESTFSKEQLIEIARSFREF